MINRYPNLLLGLLVSSTLMAQTAFSRLDVNNVDARFNATGLIGMDPENMASPGYFVPKNLLHEGVSPLFAASLWIGGITTPDTSVRCAAELYPLANHDFFPGPLGTAGQITQATADAFNRMWKVDRSEVALHLAYFNCLTDPDCDAEVQFPSYTIPASFLDWPAHGNMDEGQAYLLADFIDFDGDGNYDPTMGDAPCIPGDQALFSIYNDMLSAHTSTGSMPVGVEVQMTPFAFASSDPAIHNTTFVRYRIFNRGTQSLQQTRLGVFADFDLGCPYDDYLQCDVGRSLFYVLNSDDHDEDCASPGYGAQPPAFGIAVIKGPLMDPDGTDNSNVNSQPGYNGTGFDDGIVDNERHGLSRFIHFRSSGGPQGEPNTPGEFLGYLEGRWMDGVQLTYSDDGYSEEPDAVPAQFAFPGDSDPLGVGTNGEAMPPWTEASAGNPPWDRRGIASMGPFSFGPGDMQEVILAFVYARADSGGAAASAEALRLTTDTVRAFAATIPGLMDAGDCSVFGIAGITDVAGTGQALAVHPNPAHDRLDLVVPNNRTQVEVRILDATGQLVARRQVVGERSSIDVSDLAQGVYLIQVRDSHDNRVVRFVKE